MSIETAQARISEITSRFSAMSSPVSAPSAAGAVAPLGAPGTATGGTGGADFQRQLDAALGAGRAAPAALGVPGSASGGGGDAIVSSAKQFLGVPYLWGGTTPSGFDCSGLVQYVYRQHGIELPRVAVDQARAGVAVSPADAQPGDLVAFDNTSNRSGIDHIGIYLGGGKWIAAPKTGDVVKIQDVDLSRAVTIRRIVPPSPAGAAVPASAAGWAGGLPAAARPHVASLVAAGSSTGVDPRLLASVAWAESGFSPTARSGAGAVGMMQLMPATARDLGVDPTDPGQAALGAGKFLAEQLQSHGGRVDLALAAYNAGPNAVQKYGGIPPYPETRAYVSTVLAHFTALGGRP